MGSWVIKSTGLSLVDHDAGRGITTKLRRVVAIMSRGFRNVTRVRDNQ